LSLFSRRSFSSTVSIVKVTDDPSVAVEKAINLLGGMMVEDGDHILIKPNLCDLISCHAGATTDPVLVSGLIDYLRKDSDPKISIVESDHWVADADTEFEYLGYSSLAEERGVDTVNLSKIPRRRVKIPFSSYYDDLSIPEIFFDADKFISFAKLKTHHFEGISGVLKNQFGCIPQRYKARYHPFLPEILAALNLIIRPDLCLVDGIVAMEGLGPSAGDPKRLGIILAGFDPVGVDSVVARIAGLSPKEVPHLGRSRELGVGDFASDSDIVGEEIVDFEGALRFIPRIPFALSRLGIETKRRQLLLSKGIDEISEYLMLTGSALSSDSLSIRDLLSYGWGHLLRRVKRSTRSL